MSSSTDNNIQYTRVSAKFTTLKSNIANAVSETGSLSRTLRDYSLRDRPSNDKSVEAARQSTGKHTARVKAYTNSVNGLSNQTQIWKDLKPQLAEIEQDLSTYKTKVEGLEADWKELESTLKAPVAVAFSADDDDED